MIIDLPNTSTSQITKRLVSLRNDSGATTLGRVLTLIVVVDEDRAEEVLASAIDASHEHPSRILVLVHGNRRGASRVDGQIRVGGDAGASEVVVLRLYGEVNAQGHALVLPLLLADSPVVGWWPCEAPADMAADPVGQLCQRRINDSAVAKNPFTELKRKAESYHPGDTDLAWARITLWRALLTAALDQRPFETVTGAVVSGGVDSSATDLLAGWLAWTLDVPVTRARTPKGSGLISVRLDRPSGPLDLVRPESTTIATLTHPLQPLRRVGLKRRTDAECLADELRHLDPDEVYEASLVAGLAKVRNRNALSSQLIRSGKAPSPDESLKLSRQVARARGGATTGDETPDDATAERAAQQKKVGAKVAGKKTTTKKAAEQKAPAKKTTAKKASKKAGAKEGS